MPAASRRRERLIQRVQRYVFNPPAKALVSAGALPTTAILETTGRRTGKRRRTPVGNGLDRDGRTFWIVAEHGLGASWVRNVEANPAVRVRIGRRWQAGRAQLLPADDPIERQRALAALGLAQRITAASVRAWGTRLMTVRVDLEEPAGGETPRRRSRTAETNALERAAEALLPPHVRLFDDPYARLFVQRTPYRLLLRWRPLAMRALHWLDDRFPGMHAEIIFRARYVDSLLAGGGFDQLVLLGAGYDSTAFRHELAGTQVFEVDSPETQRSKRALVAGHGLVPRTAVVYCPCDFETDSAGAALARAGFDPARRSLFVWLGVTPYLTLDAFRATLDDVAANTASGGRLVWDYMDPDVVDETTSKVGGLHAAEWVRKRDEPYLLGFTAETAAAELDRAGFDLAEHVRPAALAERFAPPGGVWCSTEEWMGVILAERR